ncbi:MAG: hypothetical protein GY859_16810, partial [Desulfobacterales bacterium]|nr:hypothetical protein [Desulfobacterales bacterium]
MGGPRSAPLQGKVACPRGSLTGNTVKFTERGLVLIEFWLEMKTGGRCTLPIRVSDNAVGIPEDRRRAIQCLFQLADEREMALVAGTTVHGFAGLAVNGRIRGKGCTRGLA